MLFFCNAHSQYLIRIVYCFCSAQAEYFILLLIFGWKCSCEYKLFLDYSVWHNFGFICAIMSGAILQAIKPSMTSTPGRKIAPNTGANATKFFTLATKSWKLVANWRPEFLITPYLEWLLKICKDKSAAKFLVKPVSKTQHMHDFERKSIVTGRHLGFR